MKSLDAFLPPYGFATRPAVAVDADPAPETRVDVPDGVSRQKFARYWRGVRPFSGLIRVLVLRAAKRRAEAGT